VFRKLGRQNEYKKRSDGKEWNRAGVVRKLSEQLLDLDPITDGNSLVFSKVMNLKTYFITDQYSSDKATLQLNGTIFLGAGENEVMWADLISLAKLRYGPNYRALCIRKDQAWEGSSIENEVNDFFAPLFHILADERLRTKLLTGESLELKDHVFQIPAGPDHDWLRTNSQDALKANTKK